MQNLRLAVFAATLVSSSLFIATNAQAEPIPVKNPGTFELAYTYFSPALEFPSAERYNTTTGTIIVDLNSAGDIDPVVSSATFEPRSTSLSGVTVQFLVTEVSGNINAAKNSAAIALTGRLRFTGSSITGSCLTPLFTVTTSGKGTGGDVGAITNIHTEGGGLILPIPTGGTCNRAADINSWAGFDGSTKSKGYVYKAFLNTPILGG
jgi:hypothetical protein